MQLTIVDWNLNGFSTLQGQGELLAELEWDVCTLQEVTRDTWPELLGVLEPAGADVAIEHLPPLAGKLPKYYSAVLVREPWTFESHGSLRDVPSPERTLVGVMRRHSVQISVASLALPPGVSWGRAGKCRQAERIAAWLRDRALPTLVGIDANTPKWDRPELEDTEWWHDREAVLLGVDRAHDLRDSFRGWLEQDESRMEAVVAERPEGPLALSHRRGRGKRSNPCRYDYVLASPEFEVLHVEYRYEEAIEAGSDHAFVVARVEAA
ncbi:MAG: hypothetical protein R3320_05000 [Nitriliruptorales bacterium]|nr:hypothetical protein [Nitriliruptorales bacterium]